MKTHNKMDVNLDLDIINNKYKITKLKELKKTYLNNIQELKTNKKYTSMFQFFEQNLQELKNYPQYIFAYTKYQIQINGYGNEERELFYINEMVCKKTHFLKELKQMDMKTINYVYETQEPKYGMGFEDIYSLSLDFEIKTFKFRLLNYHFLSRKAPCFSYGEYVKNELPYFSKKASPFIIASKENHLIHGGGLSLRINEIAPITEEMLIH